MALTSLGKFLRKLRIDNGELLKDMAEKLNISVSMLSGIETGGRSFNREKHFNTVVEKYCLDEDSVNEFNSAIEQSVKNVNIELNDVTSAQKDLAIALARVIEDLSNDKIGKIMSIIEDDKV